MIEALAHVVETAQEVAVNVEECRISSSVIEDLKVKQYVSAQQPPGSTQNGRPRV